MPNAADTDLPIESVVPDVRAALDRRRLAVLTAEPGAGKTTVVPLRLLDEPWLAGRRIVMLEPRRLAARASAARMAQLLGESVGQTVGVVARDDRRVGPTTRIEVVTEGVLTRRLQRDPTLEKYGLVIFDEFHERSQQADLGLALLLDARHTLSLDTGILVMSATIDASRVGTLLAPDDPAPVITCAGRTFDIDMHWRPRNRRDHLEPAVVDAIRWVLRRSVSGDVLVFLPGMAEIRRVEDQLSDLDPAVDIHALHGSLPLDEQDRAVSPAPAGRRKVVLSTDIAESSLTVEGVTAVVDSGLARAPRYDPGSGLTRLTTVSSSHTSADQRAGRAGRMGPGVAVRLWSKIEHGTRSAFTAAELTQVDLAPMRLELAAWGVSDPTELSLLDPLPAKSWDEAFAVLRMLGALDGSGTITERGRQLIDLPLHPRLGSIVVTGVERGIGAMACMVAALVDERDILRGRPSEVPADLGLRLDLLVDRQRRHALASGRSIGFVTTVGPKTLYDASGAVIRRSIATASDCWSPLVSPTGLRNDAVTGAADFVCAPDQACVSPRPTNSAAKTSSLRSIWMEKNKDSRVRLGAAVDLNDLLETAGFDAEVTERLVWDRRRDDVVVRVERHLGALDLGTTTRRPAPSDEVNELLIDHVRRSRLKALSWTDAARGLQARVGFLSSRRPELDWPAVDDDTLIANLEDWFGPFLAGAKSRADVEVVSVTVALDVLIGRDRRRALDDLVPDNLVLPNGRRLRIDYSGEQPTVSSRAQDFFGLRNHPTIAGGEPLTVELLSPAGRPIQRTADLVGFWAGSWSEVRKDMAGRYPKHDWPKEP